jgi:hypothetical protein
MITAELSLFLPGVQINPAMLLMRTHLYRSVGPDGLLYVLELSDASGNPTPGAGKVVRLKRSGEMEEVAMGLTVPTALTFGPDGKLYVSNQGAVPSTGAGQIVQIDLP